MENTLTEKEQKLLTAYRNATIPEKNDIEILLNRLETEAAALHPAYPRAMH